MGFRAALRPIDVADAYHLETDVTVGDPPHLFVLRRYNCNSEVFFVQLLALSLSGHLWVRFYINLAGFLAAESRCIVEFRHESQGLLGDDGNLLLFLELLVDLAVVSNFLNFLLLVALLNYVHFYFLWLDLLLVASHLV